MQRGLAAARMACAAILLAGANDQSVEFIIQWRVAGNGTFKELADFFVALCRGSHSMALEQSARVSVHHKHRVLTSVEQDGVRGLRTNPVPRKKFFTQPRRRRTEH